MLYVLLYTSRGNRFGRNGDSIARNGERSGVSGELREEAGVARDRMRSRIGFLFYISLACKVLASPLAQCSFLKIRYSQLPTFLCGDGLKKRAGLQ
jgi:hypothetical protein